MGPQGREPTALALSKTPIQQNLPKNGTQDGTPNGGNLPVEHHLAELIHRWPSLPAGVRADILRLAGLPAERE